VARRVRGIGLNCGVDLPVGPRVEDTTLGPPLERRTLEGRLVRLREPDPERDVAATYPLTHGSPEAEAVWTYMGYGPFPTPEAMAGWMAGTVASADPMWHTVSTVDDDRAVGMAALMRRDTANRTVELGHIWYVPQVHRTGVNTETAHLMLEEAFGRYRCRRVEWKCDALNAASRHAALRLGFAFEGIFRKHLIVKGRNRDTAWFAMTDDDWPRVRETLRAWLDHPDPKPPLRAGGA
jgi:RimJ/RimL family protein N-acetyltransferase